MAWDGFGWNVMKWDGKGWHIKSHTKKKHVLVGVEGKDLGPTFFLGIDLGVLEGQISGGLFSDSIFDPSVIGASVHQVAFSHTKFQPYHHLM